MRRQARTSAGGALVVRSASALQVWLWLLLFVFQNEFRISRSIQPGYLDFDNLPETNFTCAGKVIGGYYADLETSCQMFHVCTVGQQDEPMDIKFLCLNGTVFDQETRVCERVDEVDCTKSEKFYSLNLELYGSTAPPIIQADQTKATVKPTEQSRNKPSTTETPLFNDSTTPEKALSPSVETIDSTEDPIQEIKIDEQKVTSIYPSLPPKQEELNEEYEEDDDGINDEGPEYEEEYSHPTTTTTIQPVTTTTTTTTTRRPTTAAFLLQSNTHPTSNPYLNSSPSPSISSLVPSIASTYAPSVTPSSTLDPALLSPQEFIYRHRGPGSEAISFQRQSFRPADSVYITHAPPHQFDHFQYESSRTAPRPAPRPVPFVQRPQPTPFRPTTNDPRDQMLRPSSNSANVDRKQTSIKHHPQPFPSQLPPQQSLPFNPFYYDRKRSDDLIPENESSLSARSVAPPTVKEKPIPKPKSPPRVIVTASASVSDSNGKKLNYTVGNVVSAVKPIVHINYDDYKESDLIFDPFFLDVPKLQSRRKTRSSEYKKVVTVPAPATVLAKIATEETASSFDPITLRATTTKVTSTPSTSTTTAAWNPEDYVDDNYEPHAYIPPVPPLAVLLTNDQFQYKKPEKQLISETIENKITEYKQVINEKEQPNTYIPPVPPLAVLLTNDQFQYKKPGKQLISETIENKLTGFKRVINEKEQPKLTSYVAHTISSQSVGTEATVPDTSPSPIEAPACITSRSTNCRIHA